MQKYPPKITNAILLEGEAPQNVETVRRRETAAQSIIHQYRAGIHWIPATVNSD